MRQIKDYGATEESCALYYKAMEASPEMTTSVPSPYTLKPLNP